MDCQGEKEHNNICHVINPKNMYWKLINKPFPINTWCWYWQRGLGFGLFVFLFLFLFKPFNLNLYGTQQLLFTSAIYGAITGLVIFLGGSVFIKWIVPRLNEERWTLGKQILWNMLLMVCITLLNVYVTQLVHGITLPLWWWFTMLKWVVMLGVLPIAIAELVSYNHYLRSNLKSATQLTELVQQSHKVPVANYQPVEIKGLAPDNIYNSPQRVLENVANLETGLDLLKHTLVLTGENQGDKIEMPYNSLLAVQALDNYVNVFWEESGRLQTTLLRNTLTSITEQLNDAPCMYRSHRGWLVNTKRVTQVDGNAQGLKLSVDLLPLQVPVSRANIFEYRQLTEQQMELQG